MVATIDLNNKITLDTDEIRDITSYDMLSSEVKP